MNKHSGSFAVEVEGLSVRFGDFFAVKNVTFQVPRGEIFGFLGANGAGKTTTIRVLCGLLAPTEGKARVAGLGFEDGGLAIKSKVGYMSQKFTLYEDLTVEENLSFASLLRKMDPQVFKARRKELLDFISFERSGDTLVKDLPGGVKQQVSLAASMLHDPEIIFLDEPTAGVTPASRERFWKLIQELARKGRTVFVTTHYMDEAEQCGRIALMRAGELIALDSPAALKTSSFPHGLWELEPKHALDASFIEKLSKRPEFQLFEPYGLRFHAELANPADEARLKAELSVQFQINPIQPTLEDVFIRLVEGKNR